ncbi:MAG: NAD(P)-dependent oxidoreductase, partial [Candidatus Limnocylindrales bacterium]
LKAHVADAAARGTHLLDAPVSGSVALAESGRLTLMVGGDAADLERARPVLEALGAAVFHLGPLGTGAAMKLAVNTVVFGLNEALAEGLILAEAAGIDRARAYDVLAVSAVGAPYVAYKRDAFLDPDGTPVAFALELAAKDLRLIAGLAAAVGVELPQAETNLDVIRATADAVGGDRDFTTVADQLRGGRKEDASG